MWDWGAASATSSALFPRRGWLLAGGLAPHNVAAAIETAGPHGVDTSSGVAGPDKLRKDPKKVADFVRGARRALSMPDLPPEVEPVGTA